MLQPGRMRPYQIFAGMSPEQAQGFLRTVGEAAPGALQQALGIACATMRLRPVFLQKQPFEKRAELIRKTLARVAANQLAEEMLAVYFLHCRKDLLVEWLDLIGLAHEDGALKDESPAEPEAAKLEGAVQTFRGASEHTDDRELLLRAFAAQDAIEWPVLDALVSGRPS